MITALIGIQTLCVGITTYLTIKSAKRTAVVKLFKKDKATGFKHYKTGRF